MAPTTTEGLMPVDVLDLTRQLVAIDSQNPGAGESEIADYVMTWLTLRGIPAERREFVDGRPNVIATVAHSEAPHLGLTGHLDTKPVGDAAEEWDTDPFSLNLQDGLAYGLGTSDMKGAVAAMLLALEDFAVNGSRGAVSLVLTADEEQGSAAGAQALIQNEALPDVGALIIGEPSGVDHPWEALYLVSRGICCFTVEIRTRQGHSGLSSRMGRNASLLAADVLHAFEEFAPPIAAPGKTPCEPTVNPGMMIQGGVCFGVWPGRAEVAIEIRTVPGMDRTEVMAAVEQTVAHVVGDQASATIRYEPGSLGWMPATEIDPQHPLVRAAHQAATEVLGHDIPDAAYPGGTDAGYFMGEHEVPTVVSLGPGWLSVAHGANERVGVDQLYQAQRLYRVLIRRYCELA